MTTFPAIRKKLFINTPMLIGSNVHNTARMYDKRNRACTQTNTGRQIRQESRSGWTRQEEALSNDGRAEG